MTSNTSKKKQDTNSEEEDPANQPTPYSETNLPPGVSKPVSRDNSIDKNASTQPADISNAASATVNASVNREAAQEITSNESAATSTTNIVNMTTFKTQDPKDASPGGITIPSMSMIYAINTEGNRSSFQPRGVLIPDIDMFKFVDDIPQIFELTPVDQNNNDGLDYMNTKYLNLGTNGMCDQFVRSLELFSPKNLVIKTRLRKTINGVEIPDINIPTRNVLTQRAVENGISTSEFITGREISKLQCVIRLFQGVNRYLYTIQKKTPVYSDQDPGSEYRFFKTLTVFEKGGPFILFAGINSDIGYFREWATRAMQQCNVKLGEVAPQTTELSTKSASVLQVITDQFAAHFANVNYERFINNQCDNASYIRYINANMFPSSVARLDTAEIPGIGVCYKPTSYNASNLLGYYLMSRNLRAEMNTMLVDQFAHLSIFNSLPFAKIMEGVLPASDSLSLNINNKLIATIRPPSETDITRLLACSTNANTFDYKLLNTDDTSDIAAISPLMAALAWYIICPSIAQEIHGMLGDVIVRSLRALAPAQYAQFTRDHHHITYKGSSLPDASYEMLTKERIRMGYNYSILDPNVHVRVGKNDFGTIVRDIRQLIKLQGVEVKLERKQSANLPYMNNDYNAFMPYTFISREDAECNIRTNFIERLNNIANVVGSIIELRRTRSTSASTITSSANTYINNLFNRYRQCADKSTALFHYSCARVLDTMTNCWLTMETSYDPDRGHMPSNERGFAPSENVTSGTRLIAKKTALAHFDLFLPISMVWCTNGDFITKIPVGDHKASVDQYLDSSKQIKNIEGEYLHRKYMSALRPAENYILCLYFILSLGRPTDPNNMFRELAENISSIMKLSNWLPLARFIMNEFQVDDMDAFITDCLRQVSDARDVYSILYEFDSSTDKPIRTKHLRSDVYGKDILHPDPLIVNDLRMIAQIVLNPDSPMNKTTKGFTLMKRHVPTLKPAQLHPTDWEVYHRDNITFNTVAQRGGSVRVLELRDKDGNLQEQLTLPRFDRSKPLLLHLKSFSDIPYEFRTSVSASIVWGNLAVHFESVFVNVSVLYHDNRTIDFQDDITEEKINSILMSIDGTILEQTFHNTEYAQNYTINSFVLANYVQRMYVQDFKDSIHLAGLTNTVVKPPQCVFPDLEEIASGDGTFLNRNTDGTLKVESNFINWNNAYTAISDKVFDYKPVVNYTHGL